MRATELPPVLPGCRLWHLALDGLTEPGLLDALDAQERARAGRFVFERDRLRFLAAHAAMRQLLGDALGVAPGGLDFTQGRYGKPELRGHHGLHFNLSHSQGAGVLAVSRQAELGVDIEVLRPMPDAMALAEAHFSENERRALHAIPPGEERDRAFFQGWTRKEACLKAIGAGLTLDTREIEVGIGAGSRDVALETADGVRRVKLVSPPAAGGVILALALGLSLPATAQAAQAASAARGPHATEALA